MNSLPLQRPLARRISLGRFGVAIVGVALGFVFQGCAAQTSARQLDLFVRTAPLPRLVPAGEVGAAAERQAATREGDFALRGVGRSMEPVYRAGTAVVVHPTAMHMLRRGMAVVYRSPEGHYVAHMLMQKTRDGWLAQGLNNADPDAALVTADNLVGIVRHAFVAHDTEFPAEIASRIAMRAALEEGKPMALVH